jgi:hypothetical protein
VQCYCPTCDPAWPRDPDAGFAHGTDDGIVRTSRLTDGRVLCAICMTYTWPCQLYVDAAGTTWDLCQPCGHAEHARESEEPMMTDGSPTPDIADHPGQLEVSDSHTLTLTTVLLVGTAIACSIVCAGSVIARAITGRR